MRVKSSAKMDESAMKKRWREAGRTLGARTREKKDGNKPIEIEREIGPLKYFDFDFKMLKKLELKRRE